MKNTPITKISLFALATALGFSILTTNLSYAATGQAVDAQTASSIEDYNKSDLLQAAISSAFEQTPDLVIYYDMYNDVQNVTGMQSSTGVAADGTIGKGAGPSRAHNALIEQLGRVENWPEHPQGGYQMPEDYEQKSYGELIATAKANPAYGTDAEFKAAVDLAATEHDMGVNSLRVNLLRADPTLTDLDTKTDAELLAIYENLPAVKNRTYDDMIEDIEIAYSIVRAYEDGSVDKDILAKLAVETYKDFITSIKTINPDFKVDLSNVPKLPTNQSSATPTAPNSGDTKDSELSATITAIAVTSVVAASSILGIAVVAKRYLFSPLKRRK